ncbi:hypothetical protein EWM64_g1256 [Hericium alpestre]|uniref:F-box domain-containing protein n=1 Tax=Hericium alpestre TaxID=135208 RepID=A0A4Z0A8W4_9AGAM|nr:hypothetical protein EWM64_g1256 [Hericium alpestre]
MGRGWYLINLDKRQYRSMFKLEDLFVSGSWEDDKLFWPVPSVHIGKPSPAKDAGTDIRTSLNSSIFSRLPLELYDNIFESLDYYFDCVCLGLVCRLLWNVAHRHVRKRYIENAPGSWAGDRIICAEDYCKRNDPLPPGLLTEEEEKEWNTPLPTTGCGCENMHKPNTLSQSLADFAVCRFTDQNTPMEVRRKTDYRATRDAIQRQLCRYDRRLLDAVLDKSGTPVYEEVEMEAPRILRNLSRKEYVREDALDQFMEDEEELMDEYGYGVCFAHVILMRVCWSPRGGPALRDPTDKTHGGPWAGDRFDYMSAKDFRTVEKGDDGQMVEWRDISAEVVWDIKSLWGAALIDW